MVNRPTSVRLLLIGTPGGEFRLAAAMARDAGAEVMMADTPASALEMLRMAGADLVMIDVGSDVADFIINLRLERFSLPVLACGIDAPAERAVAAIRAGAVDYVPLPPVRELIAAAITSIVARPSPTLIGQDPAFVQATSFALAMARAETPMLIFGERGSGKETLARAVHDSSGRPGPFLTLDCAGASESVIESELFGHEKGAFQGAPARRLGVIEKSSGGTLFLRAIEALALPTQSKLMALLRNGSARRLGEGVAFVTETRIIASTSADVETLATQGALRADLLARLSFVRVGLPPLRSRPGDLASLAAYFSGRLAGMNALPVRPIDPQALNLLRGYGWPGNVREFEDVLHRAVLLEHGQIISASSIVLFDGSRLDAMPTPHIQGVGGLVGLTVEEVERDLILRTLEQCRGNRTSASGILGISIRTMRNKLRSFIEAGIAVAPA